MVLPAAGVIILKLFHSWNIVALGIASSMIIFVVFGLAISIGCNSKNSEVMEFLMRVAMC